MQPAPAAGRTHPRGQAATPGQRAIGGYYASRSDASLLPNEAAHGRRRDEHGPLLPCNQFPIRATRGCLGCGCAHEDADAHGLDALLAEADRCLPRP